MPSTKSSAGKVPAGLKRYPHHPRQKLQAWDSADELLLEHLATIDLTGKRVLILNDQFGALAAGLVKTAPNLSAYTDSYLSARATDLNTQGQVKPESDLTKLSGYYDLAVIRIPKNMSYFEDLLCHLSGHLKSGAQVICGYMIKHQAKASFDLLEKIIGKTHTSLAKKKARLIFASLENQPSKSPYPLSLPIEKFKTPFIQQSNLFSREKLDIGTRFFLENLPAGVYPLILDLGCGNGIVGIAAKKANPLSKILFADESQMAIESARANYQAQIGELKSAEFHWTNCYENQEPSSVNLVLCNPPFHQGNVLGDSVARQMFADAHRALKPGGLLRVIGNSHLHYHTTLKKLFGNSKLVASNRKFMVVDAIKR